MKRAGVRTEKIWMNHLEGRSYFHGFTGKDYNYRHRVKRKTERWRAKYTALLPAEQLVVLVARNEVDANQ